MVAYNKTDLNNLSLQLFASKALKAELITKEEYNNILLQYPVRLYSPNIFLRIGLGLLVSIVSTAIIGLLLLLSDAKEPASIMLFTGIVSVIALEMSIRKWKHYRSGIDDILLHSGILYLLLFVSFQFNFGQEILLSAFAFLLYSVASLRYLDRLAAIFAPGALISLIYNIFDQWNVQQNSLVYFVVAAIMALMALVIHWIQKKAFFITQHHVLQMAKYTAMIACYGSLHYYVVEQDLLGNSHIVTNAKKPVFLDWFHLGWTILLPVCALYYGFRKKDRSWIRIGIALIIAVFFYWQYEFIPIEHEIAAVLYGMLLVAIAYSAINYLKTNNSNFTDEIDPGDNDWKWVESMAISAGFSGQASAGAPNESAGTNFGGGNFGGGGASSEF